MLSALAGMMGIEEWLYLEVRFVNTGQPPFMCGHISGNSMWYRLKLRCHGPATVSSSGTSRPWQKGVAISEVIAARANVTVGKGLVAYPGGKWLESNETMHLRPSQGLTAPRDP
jgi:hypothetical protein